jgi:hypothetical protein
MYSAPQEFGIKTIQKKVLNGFWTMAEAALPVAILVTPGKVILG